MSYGNIAIKYYQWHAFFLCLLFTLQTGVLPVVIGSTAPVSFITTTPQIAISQPTSASANNIKKVVTPKEKPEVKVEMPEVHIIDMLYLVILSYMYA